MRTLNIITRDGDTKEVPVDVGRHLIQVGSAALAPDAAPEAETPAETPTPELLSLRAGEQTVSVEDVKPAGRRRGGRDAGSDPADA